MTFAGWSLSRLPGCQLHSLSSVPRARRSHLASHCVRSRRASGARPACMASASSQLEQVLFVETGVGCDQHGQNVTKAAVRACRNAIEFNSIPSIKQIVPGGYDGMRLVVKVGCPRHTEVDVEELRKVFPYAGAGAVIEVVEGGLCCSSGIIVPHLGDTTDDMLIAIAAVTVGY